MLAEVEFILSKVTMVVNGSQEICVDAFLRVRGRLTGNR